MTEPQWAEAIRARTERLIEELTKKLPENAGPVSVERALTETESGYLRDVAQEIINSAPDEKKV